MERGKQGNKYLDEVLEDGLKVLVGAVVEGVDGFGALEGRHKVNREVRYSFNSTLILPLPIHLVTIPAVHAANVSQQYSLTQPLFPP